MSLAIVSLSLLLIAEIIFLICEDQKCVHLRAGELPMGQPGS